MRLPRPRRIPQAVRDRQLAEGERRVGWALTDDGRPVVATQHALLLPDGARLAWHQVEKAVWQPPELTVLSVADVQGAGGRHALRLQEAGDLPAVVRARVTASVAWATHEKLSPHGGVRIVGRRRSGQATLSWQLVYDTGTDPDDPLVRAQAEALLDAARDSVTGA